MTPSARQFAPSAARRAYYAEVMSIKRITISVPSDVASRIKKAAGRLPVSAWVTEVIEQRLDDATLEAEWQRFCAEVRPRGADTRRATSIFKRLTETSRKRGGA